MQSFQSDLSGSRIDERDHDVARALGHVQTLVEVRQTAGMHQDVALFRVGDSAVVPNESHAATLFQRGHSEGELHRTGSLKYLVVDAGAIQCKVDGVRR